jgi:hypothetical protein
MKTKITSIALLVLAGLFTSTGSAKAYINMPDDLTWDASVGIFPVITQPAAAYYTAQRAYEAALSAYEAATSAYNTAEADYFYGYYNGGNIGALVAAKDAAWATKISAQTAYSQSLDNVNAATSADPLSSFHITVYSSQKIFNLALGANEAALSAYNTAEADYFYGYYNGGNIGALAAAKDAAWATKISTQAPYDQSVTTLRAAVSSANAVPEPSTYGLIGVAALGVAFAARRRKLKKTA